MPTQVADEGCPVSNPNVGPLYISLNEADLIVSNLRGSDVKTNLEQRLRIVTSRALMDCVEERYSNEIYYDTRLDIDTNFELYTTAHQMIIDANNISDTDENGVIDNGEAVVNIEAQTILFSRMEVLRAAFVDTLVIACPVNLPLNSHFVSGFSEYTAEATLNPVDFDSTIVDTLDWGLGLFSDISLANEETFTEVQIQTLLDALSELDLVVDNTLHTNEPFVFTEINTFPWTALYSQDICHFECDVTHTWDGKQCVLNSCKAGFNPSVGDLGFAGDGVYERQLYPNNTAALLEPDTWEFDNSKTVGNINSCQASCVANADLDVGTGQCVCDTNFHTDPANSSLCVSNFTTNSCSGSGVIPPDGIANNSAYNQVWSFANTQFEDVSKNYTQDLSSPFGECTYRCRTGLNGTSCNNCISGTLCGSAGSYQCKAAGILNTSCTQSTANGSWSGSCTRTLNTSTCGYNSCTPSCSLSCNSGYIKCDNNVSCTLFKTGTSCGSCWSPTNGYVSGGACMWITSTSSCNSSPFNNCKWACNSGYKKIGSSCVLQTYSNPQRGSGNWLSGKSSYKTATANRFCAEKGFSGSATNVTTTSDGKDEHVVKYTTYSGLLTWYEHCTGSGSVCGSNKTVISSLKCN